jgi:hypothetical protein
MFTPGLAARWALPGLLAVAGAVAAAVWVVRRWSRRAEDTRVGVVAALSVLALPASLGAFGAIRFVGVASLTLVPVAAMGAAHVARRVRQRLAQEPRGLFRNARVRFWADGRHWRTVVVLLLVVLSPGVLLLSVPLGRPLAEIPVVERLPRDCRLVSDPGSAATAILIRPDVSVWIDGRADYYGRERNAEALHLLGSDGSDSPALAQATCVVLNGKTQVDVTRLVAALDRDPRWQRMSATDGGLAAWTRR